MYINNELLQKVDPTISRHISYSEITEDYEDYDGVQ